MERFEPFHRRVAGARHEEERAGGPRAGSARPEYDPAAELEYWRNRFETRPYARDHTFEEFEAAYTYALRMYPAAPGLEFDDVELALEDGWHWNRDDSPLTWHEARHATRDAWNRIAEPTRRRVWLFDRALAQRLNGVIRVLHDRRLGFQQAALEVDSDRLREVCVECVAQSRRFINELSAFVLECGERPAGSGTVLGSLGRGWSCLRRAAGAGDRAVLAACERGEDETLEAYTSSLLSVELTHEHRAVVARQHHQVQVTHEAIRAWRDSL